MNLDQTPPTVFSNTNSSYTPSVNSLSSASSDQSFRRLFLLPNGSSSPLGTHFSQPNVPLLFATNSDTPTVEDTLAVLKLWKAVSVLKSNVCINNPTIWPVFVAWALRRFALFASALAASEDKALHVLPPLDVAWVWHSLLMAPEACYAMFARSGMAQFLDVSFPLKPIADAIDQSFNYVPDSLAMHNFNALLAGYGNGYSLSYDFSDFDPSMALPIYCPVSKNFLASASLAHFVCSSFLVRCQEGIVSHHSLARRQSDADYTLVTKPIDWPAFYSPGTPEESSSPSSPTTSISSLLTPVSSLKSYLFESAAPLLHLTIEDDCLQILGDWIDHLVLSPVQNMVDAENWLFHPQLPSMLKSAVERYKAFWKIVPRNPTGLVPVPTLDIRLVWYAHMGRFNDYANFSVFNSKRILVPPKTGVQSTKDFDKTASLFRKRFHVPYCPCGHLDGSPAYARDSCALSCYRHVYDLLAPCYD